MHETQVVFSFVIKTRRYAAEVLQPSEKTLDFPSTFVAAHSSAVLRLWFLPVLFMRRNHFNALLFQLCVQRIRVISLITNQSDWVVINETCLKSFCNKADFVRRSTRCVDGEWKRSIVCHHHEFRALAPLSLTTRSPLFWRPRKCRQ